MEVSQSMFSLIGNTPLLQANRLMEREGVTARLLLKLDSFNPLGSAKDRAAYAMLTDAIERGALQTGGTLIEPTSGNTGVGLAYLCAAMGYTLILTMPESMSEERKSLLRALGAKLVLTSAAGGMDAAVKEAERLQKEIPGSLILGQFTNPANALAHYRTTGPELWKAAGPDIGAFVAGVGTGGTITGTGRYLKEQNPNIRIVAVEPASSPLLSGGKAGPHKIQGIGANFIPEVLDRSLIDEIITVSDEDAYAYTKLLARTEGAFCGISSGAAVCAAIKLAKRSDLRSIVAFLPDTGERYLSTGVYED